MKKTFWAVWAAGLMALAFALRYGAGIHYPAYALGAVSLLASLGATHIAFGAETDNLPLLRRAADIMQSQAGTLEPVLRDMLASGCGYPAALSAALPAVLPEARGLLDHPNNTLAVCYLRALRRLSLPLTPVLVHRQGAYRTLSVDPVSPSASALRNSLLRGSWAEASAALPSFSDRLIRRRFLEQRIPDPSVLDAILLSCLRSMPPEEYRCLPDLSCSSGFSVANFLIVSRNCRLIFLVGTVRE